MAGGYLEWNVWKNALFSMLLAAIICPGSVTFSSFKSKQRMKRQWYVTYYDVSCDILYNKIFYTFILQLHKYILYILLAEFVRKQEYKYFIHTLMIFYVSTYFVQYIHKSLNLVRTHKSLKIRTRSRMFLTIIQILNEMI